MATPLDYVMGLGELGATLGTGAVSGLVGAPYGLYKGITSGKYGTPEAVKIAQQQAADFMARNTYQPRGQVAQEALQGLGGLLSESKLPPVMPEAMLFGSIPKQAYAAQAERTGMAAERALAPVVTRTMERGGLPAQLLGDLSQGSRRQIFVPASSEESLRASRMLKTMKPEDVWRETGVGNWGGEYVKEISDKGAKFNTVQDIAADAQKIRDRNAELKQTIKESQSTYPDLFPKELTAARRPLREEIKANQNMLERNYGYESDSKWAGNFAQLAYEHPELYKEFPELKNVVIRQGREGGPYLGSYERLPHLQVGSVDVYGQSLRGNPKSTATHEMQHAVQDISGWQSGGTPEQFMSSEVTNGFTPFENYQRLAGEAQARLAQTRLDLTPEERLQYYPFAQGKYGLDVSPDELMFDTGLLGR